MVKLYQEKEEMLDAYYKTGKTVVYLITAYVCYSIDDDIMYCRTISPHNVQ